MTMSAQTESWIKELDEFSGHRIRNSGELICLLEIVNLRNEHQLLNDIAFFSKFVWKVYGVIQRNGPGSEGHEKLQTEFNEKFGKVSALINRLIEGGPEEVKRQFDDKYLIMDHDATGSLLDLVHDLSWLQNWNIEHKITK
jgi:hypothetical protein